MNPHSSAPIRLRCDGLARRDFLHLGLLTTFGLSVTDLLRLSAANPAPRAKSCILIWLDGGPSHLGSLVAHESGFTQALPPYVAIPGDAVGGNSNAAHSGYLPGAFSAFNVGPDPSRVRDLSPPGGISFARGEHRREMLLKMDAFTR